MDPLETMILISGFILAMSCFIDANWKYIKGLINWLSPRKLLAVLRLTEGISTLSLLLSVTMTMLCKFFRVDLTTALVSSTATTVTATVLAGQLLSKKGAKLSPEETVDERDLRAKIEENMEKMMSKAAATITENVERRMMKAETNIQQHTENYYKRLDALLERNEETLREFGGKIDVISKVIEGYNAMVQVYREEARKREALMIQIEEVVRMQEQYQRKLESLEKEEVREEKVTLTRANGLASRTKGNRAQKETADFLRSLGFQVEEYYGVGLPDYIIRWQGRRVAIGAHKAFTLSRQGTAQRTITKDELEAEINAALKYRLLLILIITNLKNGRRWAEVIPYEKLKEFERFTTPVILTDDVPETQRICIESIQRLKEILSHQTTD